jgi:hypothetical protein
MTRKVTGLALMAPAALLAAVMGTGPAEAATKAQLTAKALSISNFPTGWFVDNSSGGATKSGCLKSLTSSFKHEVKAEVAYTDGNLPALQETLEVGPGVSARYNRFVKVLNACKTLSYSAGGQAVHGTIGEMSFPKVGTRSSAYAAMLTVQGVTAGVDIILFQVGSVLGDVVYEDFSPDPDQVQAFVTEAIRKIEGKATTVPTG